MRTLLLFFLLLVPWLARAEPTWVNAPRELEERPEIQAPPDGWSVTDGQYARVFYAPEHRGTGLRLASHAAEAVPRLATALGVSSGSVIDVYLAPTQEIFQSVQPGTPPEWADGTAWTKLSLVFLRAESARARATTPLEVVLDHEIVHILLGRAFNPHPTPRWLQEGMAQFYAGEIGFQTANLLSQTGAEGFYPLAQITRGFPAGAFAAQIAYAQSVDFIAYIARNHGEGSLRSLVAEMVAGRSFEAAVETATGRTAAALEAGWREPFEDPLLAVTRYADMNWLFALGSVAIVVGAVVRWRRGRKKLERWEREEALWAAARAARHEDAVSDVVGRPIVRRVFPDRQPRRGPDETWH